MYMLTKRSLFENGWKQWIPEGEKANAIQAAVPDVEQGNGGAIGHESGKQGTI